MPILTAIRLARSDRNGLGPPPPEASHTNRNGNGDGASTGDGRGAAALTHDSSKGRNLWWQWFELSPIEVGSSDVGAWYVCHSPCNLRLAATFFPVLTESLV